jgi:hypothetical protein
MKPFLEVSINIETVNANDRDYNFEVRTTRIFGVAVWVTRRVLFV